MNTESRASVAIRYVFRFGSGATKDFTMRLDPQTLELLVLPQPSYPEWTRLTYHQCPNCPLDPAVHERCPIAKNVVHVVDFFEDSVSFEEVDVTVESQGRTYGKKTSLQQAISSLVGIFMVTSGCPVLNKLRPMVATHLPFMTPAETIYRMLSMYLTAQYFLQKNGKKADMNLSGFLSHLDEARMTNTAFCRRLQSLGIADASLNALNMLNAMGEIARITVEADDLSRWERLFLTHYA